MSAEGGKARAGAMLRRSHHVGARGAILSGSFSGGEALFSGRRNEPKRFPSEKERRVETGKI